MGNPTTTDAARHEESHPAWWNPWHWPAGIWVLVIGLLLLMLPFGIRAVMLAGVPAMAEPFDVDEFVKWDVPAEDDAFTEYRQAAELLKRLGPEYPAGFDPEKLDAILTKGWDEVDESIKQWLEAHREAPIVWRRGTEKGHALNLSPEKLTYDSDIPNVQDLRLLARLAGLESIRCLHEGSLDEAWHWLRAAHRSGGHITHWGIMIQGLYGAAIHATSAVGMSRWAEQPAVTADQLKRALVDVRSDYALYESESNMFKAEYLGARNTLSNSKWIDFVDFVGSPGLSQSSGVRAATKMGLWIVGEPELTLRIFRQTLANQIREVDKPLASRRKLVGVGIAMLFDPDPSVPLLPGQLDPAAIDRAINRSFVARQLLPAMKQFDNALRRQAARQAALEIVLAAQAYRRDHGEFPDSLQRLVPDYVKSVPADPCDPLGGPVLYRRDDVMNAVVWSVGEDGVDGGVDVDDSKTRSSDVGFLLK